jgi:hypothetical protein
MFLINPYSFGGGNLFAATSSVGNGGTQNIITGQNLAAGGLVFGKNVGSGGDWACRDTVRGNTKRLILNASNSEITDGAGYLTSFNSNGVTYGENANENTNGVACLTLSWLEQAGYMDVVTYSGNSANRTVAHNLGAAFKFGIFKSRSASGKWIVYHDSIGATKYLTLNETTAAITDSQQFQDTAPTSSVFSLGTSGDVNDAAATYVAYLFAQKAGKSKFGSYTGTGASNAITGLGFTPRLVMVKRIDSTGDWWIAYKDGSTVYMLKANDTAARSGALMTFDADGFTLGVSSNVNASSATYIYSAWG